MSSHWEIGKLLEERKLDSKHGDQIVRRLSVDLKERYPNMGVSPRNLWDMRRFYIRYYQCNKKVQRCVAPLSWRHNQFATTIPNKKCSATLSWLIYHLKDNYIIINSSSIEFTLISHCVAYLYIYSQRQF